MHVVDGLVVHLEEQIGAFSMTFRNRFPDSFFLQLFRRFGVHFGSHFGSFWASIFDRHLDGFLDWIWGGLGGAGFEITRGVHGFHGGLWA